MGWDYQPKCGKVNVKYFITNRIDASRYEVLDVAYKAMVAYSAVKNLATGEVTCGVHLLRITKHEIGCKGMHEDMHPFYYDCPKRIFNLLTPTTNEESLEWRKTVVLGYEREKMYKGIKEGDTVELARTYNFSGVEFSKFKCVDKRLGHYRAFNDESSMMVKLTKSNFVSAGFK